MSDIVERLRLSLNEGSDPTLDDVLDSIVEIERLQAESNISDSLLADAKAENARLRAETRQIVCEEWHQAVAEFSLSPGSYTETVVARIINRLDAKSVESEGEKG